MSYLFNPIDFQMDFNFSLLMLSLFGGLLSIIALRLAIKSSIIAMIVTLSLFSLLITILYLLMDAPDVAMTEAALGVCFSTAVLINTLKIVGKKDKKYYNHDKDSSINFSNISLLRKIFTIALCAFFLVSLIYIGLSLPEYGEGQAALHQHVGKYYIENTAYEIGVPSIVAAVLASYRGYDTLGESIVILVAGLGVLLILSKKTNVPKK